MVKAKYLLLIFLIGIILFAACQKPTVPPTVEKKPPVEEKKPPAAPKPEKKPAPPVKKKPEVKPVVKKPVCEECHKNVGDFHYIPILSKIQEMKGLPKRDCTTCHGKVEQVHDIHKRKLEAGEIKCDTCHRIGGKLVIPKKLPNQTYVCERCHGNGNYIVIHKSRCERCHPTNIKAIHSKAVEEALEKYQKVSKIKIPEEDYEKKPCSDCHVRLLGIHYLNITSRIDFAKNISERNCTTCHGPVKYVHVIHKGALEEGRIKCQTCHLFKEYTYIIPEKKPHHKVVCQLCHFEGNMIKIHKGICSRCHYGTLGQIHSKYLEKLLEEIKEAMK